MKILYLITGLRLGGAEKQVLLLTKLVQEAGHDVQVVAMESNGALVPDFKRTGITVYELGAKNIIGLPAVYQKLKKVVDEFKPDVIHSHMIHANLFAGIFKLFNPKNKLICTAHNIREGSSIAMSSYHFIKMVSNWSTNVSREAFDHFSKKEYFDKIKSSFIPNAIDTDVFDPMKFDREAVRKQLNIADDFFVFFSAGRLHHQKNYPMLLKAFAGLSKYNAEVLLYIAGEGTELASLQTICYQLGITNKVVFLGRRDDIPALMKMSDCFVLTSKFEGFGLVIGEAMAMQLPVISTNCGGVKEVMGGYGCLIAVDNLTELESALNLAPLSKNHDDLVKARCHVITNYSMTTLQRHWLQLYQKVCYPD